MKRENREIDMNHDLEAIDTDMAVLRGRKKRQIVANAMSQATWK